MAKDYYSILGVLPSASHEVIKAVYRVLAKKHHPDSGGDAVLFRLVTEAYETLGDPTKRREYDSQASSSGSYNANADETDGEEGGLVDEEIRNSWQIAIEYHPELEGLKSELYKLSPSLAFVFQTTVVVEKQFARGETVKEELERDFLHRFFGSHAEVHTLARFLLLNRKLELAKELNRTIVVLGDKINPKKIVIKFSEKHQLPGYSDAERKDPLKAIIKTDGGKFVVKKVNGGIYMREFLSLDAALEFMKEINHPAIIS